MSTNAGVCAQSTRVITRPRLSSLLVFRVFYPPIGDGRRDNRNDARDLMEPQSSLFSSAFVKKKKNPRPCSDKVHDAIKKEKTRVIIRAHTFNHPPLTLCVKFHMACTRHFILVT